MWVSFEEESGIAVCECADGIGASRLVGASTALIGRGEPGFLFTGLDRVAFCGRWYRAGFCAVEGRRRCGVGPLRRSVDAGAVVMVIRWISRRASTRVVLSEESQ